MLDGWHLCTAVKRNSNARVAGNPRSDDAVGFALLDAEARLIQFSDKLYATLGQLRRCGDDDSSVPACCHKNNFPKKPLTKVMKNMDVIFAKVERL